MNAMLNTWNQVQCRTTLHWSRFVSGYETGLGRGMGTRDSAQDTVGTMHALPDEARRTLSRTWALQFRDGHAWHQLFPLTGEGGPGLAAEHPAWPQWFSDDHLWLVLATCAYLRETGDIAYLDERIALADGGDDTVRGHIERAIGFTLAHRGPHGLPRAGFADWDDTLNVDHGSGKAESVFAAMLLCRVALDLAELCEHLGRDGDAARQRGLHAEMAATVNAVAWDGAWYARAFDDDGRPVGVAADERHQINLVPQAWAVLGEVAPPDRAERALRSVEELLGTPFGSALLWPPYDGADERVGGTATYPPGAKENGGIFCHANAWLVIAAAMLGRADDAYRGHRRILPLARADQDRLGTEPYVYAQNICGPAHPQFGLGRNAWLTGTAAWAFVAATQWILGYSPDPSRAAHRPGHPDLVAGVPRPAGLPGDGLRDRGPSRRRGECAGPHGGRALDRGIGRPRFLRPARRSCGSPRSCARRYGAARRSGRCAAAPPRASRSWSRSTSGRGPPPDGPKALPGHGGDVLLGEQRAPRTPRRPGRSR